MRCIDSEELKENLTKWFPQFTLEGIEAKILFKQILHDIDNAPTVNERQRGEWMVTAEDNDGIHRIECPFCRYEKGSDYIDYIMVTFEKLPPFCENCGADMRGEEK